MAWGGGAQLHAAPLLWSAPSRDCASAFERGTASMTQHFVPASVRVNLEEPARARRRSAAPAPEAAAAAGVAALGSLFGIFRPLGKRGKYMVVS